ncbi:MAG: ABC transporter ATP-binding protein [bacterium]|nr:ABC transporter ATP-binding protein [bacterium]
MIALKNITKSYTGNTVLDNISLTVPEKSITGIIGPNGAGKSTLIRIIAGFEFSDSGAVHIKENPNQTKKHISYMPEYMLIYPEYTVGEFLSFYHAAVNLKDDQLLTELSLNTVKTKNIKHLSKGWHQRLKLYTALCNAKPIVLLDEPFDGFDPLQLRDIIDIFKTQNANGRTFLMSIHQLAYAQKICDYYIFLNAGLVIAEGSLEMLKSRYPGAGNSLEDIFLKALEK